MFSRQILLPVILNTFCNFYFTDGLIKYNHRLKILRGGTPNLNEMVLISEDKFHLRIPTPNTTGNEKDIITQGSKLFLNISTGEIPHAPGSESEEKHAKDEVSASKFGVLLYSPNQDSFQKLSSKFENNAEVVLEIYKEATVKTKEKKKKKKDESIKMTPLPASKSTNKPEEKLDPNWVKIQCQKLPSQNQYVDREEKTLRYYIPILCTITGPESEKFGYSIV